MSPHRPRTRTLLLVTFLIFMLPVAAAWLLNVYAPGWRPFGTVNHGTLVQPVRHVSAAGLHHFDGSPLDGDYLSGRWTLVHVAHGVCARSCEDALRRSFEVRQALGEDQPRLQLLLVLPRAPGAESAKMPPGFERAAASEAWLAQFLFSEPAPDPGVYLVDPQGYLMMRYSADVDRRGLLADLQRLLKISKIG
jgi:cytochrome oxidase Cu insertion factor (SCO1/SenC/PrrC family)